MTSYDYKEGKKRVEEILNNKTGSIRKEKVPKDEAFSFENSYRSWVTGIFIDIRDSTTLFKDTDSLKVSKIIRSFTSEVIDILYDDEIMREIGIRGDCIYAIYTTPDQSDIYNLADKTFYINTFMKMLNKLLAQHRLPAIKVGIGMASYEDLVIKAGRKHKAINSKVWVGKAVPLASNFSSLGNKNGNDALVYSECSYKNFIELLEKNNPKKRPREWFEKKYDDVNGWYYTANVIKVEFDEWVEAGMKD